MAKMAVGSARAAAGWSTAVARPLTVAATGTTMMVTRAERGAEGLAEMAVVAVATATRKAVARGAAEDEAAAVETARATQETAAVAAGVVMLVAVG